MESIVACLDIVPWEKRGEYIFMNGGMVSKEKERADERGGLKGVGRGSVHLG